jgi:hypothetical protein
MRALVWIAVLALAACDEDDSAVLDEPEVPRAAALPPAECAQRVATMAAALPERGPLEPRPGGETLPLAENAGEVILAPVVTVRNGAALVDGRRVTEMASEDAAERLATELERVAGQWALLHPEEPWEGRVLLEVPSTEPARELWTALTALSSDLVWDVLVQNARAPEPAPPGAAPAWVEESWRVALDAPTFAARRPELERSFHRAIGDCLAARPHVHLLYLNDPQSGSAPPLDLTLEEALRACGCIGVDFEALTALLLRGMAPRHRALAALRIRVTDDAPDALTLEPGATFADLVGRLDRLPSERRSAPVSVDFD